MHFHLKSFTTCSQNPKRSVPFLCSVDEQIRCFPGSCVITKKKFPVMIVALVSSAVVVILVVLVLIFVFKKKKPSNLEGIRRNSYTMIKSIYM